MLTIKFTPYRPNLGKIYHRQSKNHKCCSLDGKYRFYITEDIDEADFWVVHGKGVRQATTCKVAPANVIFLNTEPKSVLKYPHNYLKQFGLVSTSQYPTEHPNVKYAPPVLPWFVGYKYKSDGNYTYTIDYDTLTNNTFPEKTKLISVISSNLAVSRGHINRLKFVQKLKKYYGDKIDIYGRGFNGFDDKWDILSQYKYHICLENCSEQYYWTEKISDCFLTGCFPFYYGCTNFAEYFPSDSFLPIDIANFQQTVETIDNAIQNNRWEQSFSSLEASKKLVLDKYNMFEYIASLCDTLDPDAKKEHVTIRPCKSSMDLHNLANYLLFRNYYKTEMKIYNLFHKD